MSTPSARDVSPTHDEYSGDSTDGEMAVVHGIETRDDQHSPGNKTNSPNKPTSSAKDPTRPRRKKARRACFACQRAHLTCGDERPCDRCTKRGLQDSCMDGVRKKAKYLHDAPDGALMPGLGGHYPHVNASRPVSLPSQDQSNTPVQQLGGFYAQAPTTNYYPSHTGSGPTVTSQEQTFAHPQAPISPPYTHNAPPVGAPPHSTTNHTAQEMQFGGPLFDPSDPALFNFDITSLNFGNHYGALELGMLGHMSSGAGDPATQMNTLDTTAGLYPQQMASGPYGDPLPAHVSFGPDGSPSGDWQAPSSQHNTLQMHTPSSTPLTGTLDHPFSRHDSVNGPHAYAIGQGSSNYSSASPASIDFNSGYENEHSMATAAFFANANPAHPQVSPTTNRIAHEARPSSGPLQPLPSNQMRKRRPDTKSIYERVTKPYDYVASFHRLIRLLRQMYSDDSLRRAQDALARFRPVLLSNATDLDGEDLVHAEKNLQRSLVTMHLSFAEVGTPCLICRRTGEVVGMNKEFEILTGWRREVLLGHIPNLNVNAGPARNRKGSRNASHHSDTTPVLSNQEPNTGLHAVNILELMDEPSALQYLDDFADLAYEDPLGKGHRRVNMLRYLTKDDMARLANDRGSGAKSSKHESGSRARHEEGQSNSHAPSHSVGGIHQGEAAMRHLGGSNGLIDAMIMWHIKRDNFEMPMLVTMQIMPMLKP